tara:strand:- start:4429 stop:6141 length:1713 start_codon:yes stop_codon:yes gene_type:complete
MSSLLAKQQLEKEVKIISSFKRCNLKYEFKDIKDIEEKLVKSHLDKRFFDINFMSTLFCIFDGILYQPMDDKSNSFGDLFRNMRKIGSESSNGHAVMVALGKSKKAFIIKVPMKKSEDELFHEYFIGVSCLNNLRKIIPNFAYIFGAYKCLPPVINPDKSVSSWCETNNMKSDYVNYVIYENISGLSFRDSVKDCSLTEFFSWYIQILYAIQIASDRCDYTHYDLHDENVILKNWHDIFMIPYQDINGKTVYVKSNRISTMIDYGMSHVKVNDEDFGLHHMEGWGIYQDKSRPLYDAYKLLGFTLYNMRKAKNQTFYKAIELMRAFIDPERTYTQEKLIDILTKEHEVLHILGTDMLVIEDNFTLWEIINYYRKNESTLWKRVVFDSPMKKVPILSCADLCVSKDQAEKMIKTNPEEEIVSGMNMISQYPKDKHSIPIKNKIESNVIKLRDDLSTMLKKIDQDMNYLNNSTIESFPKEINQEQFRDIIEEYVEPNIDLRENIMIFMQKRTVLDKYYKNKGQDYDLTEFELDSDLETWKTNYKILWTKLNNLFVPPNIEPMRKEIIKLMKL